MTFTIQQNATFYRRAIGSEFGATVQQMREQGDSADIIKTIVKGRIDSLRNEYRRDQQNQQTRIESGV